MSGIKGVAALDAMAKMAKTSQGRSEYDQALALAL